MTGYTWKLVKYAAENPEHYFITHSTASNSLCGFMGGSYTISSTVCTLQFAYAVDTWTNACVIINTYAVDTWTSACGIINHKLYPWSCIIHIR